jgi:hypothetical protein
MPLGVKEPLFMACVALQRFHPDKRLELSQIYVDKVLEYAIGTSGSQSIARFVSRDTNTSQTGFLGCANTG